MSSAAPAEAKSTEESGPKPPKGPLIIALVNTLVILGAMGTLIYTRLIFKRPKITEAQERARIEASIKTPPPPSTSPGLIQFEPLTANIEPIPPQLQPSPTGKVQGKLHYCTIGFSLEVRDLGQQDAITAIKPMLIDKILSVMGKKPYYELTTVQGRYLLRQQIVNVANELLAERKVAPLVTDVYFTQFVVQ